MTKKNDDIEKGPVFQKLLPVELTEPELAERGKELGAKLDEIEELELEMKEERDDANVRKKALLERVKELRKQTRTETEERDVPCQEVKDLGQGSLTVVRNDSGEAISTRALSLQERQGDFAFHAGQGPADELGAGDNPESGEGNDAA